jgi:hypothetical protein
MFEDFENVNTELRQEAHVVEVLMLGWLCVGVF